MTTPFPTLCDPFSGQSLVFRPLTGPTDERHGFWETDCRTRRWPHLDGIAFIHAGFAEAAIEANRLLDEGKPDVAIAHLLTLTDPFAKSAPTPGDTAALVARMSDQSASRPCATEAMKALAFGPVADYFALRGSAPTFFSGLGLLALGLPSSGVVVDIACGIGHYLYWLSRHGYRAIGTEYVYAKLWIARHFMVEAETPLVCADACEGRHFPVSSTHEDVSTFCHDALYFLPAKQRAMERFERLRRGRGRVLIGHAHLSDFDHGEVAGSPLSAADYLALCTDRATVFDDAQLARFGVGLEDAKPITGDETEHLEAIALVTPTLESRAVATPAWPKGEPLGLAPCVTLTEKRATHPRWPADSFAREYANASYLSTSRLPASTLPRRARPGAHVGPSTVDLGGLAVPERFIAASIQPVRWAVVGAGWIAVDHVIPALQASPWARLVALAESNPDSRTAVQEEVGPRVRFFESIDSLLRAERIDAVYVATPNASHPSIVERVADYGAQVLCEKPLAPTVVEAAAMVERCAQRGVRLVTAFDQRYHPAHQRLTELVADGALGDITQARINYACWLPTNWRKSRIASPNWRIDSAQSGGGAGIDLLPHGLDLLCMLLDDAIVSVQAEVQSGTQDYADLNNGIDDGVALLVRFRRGTLATIHAGYNRPEWQPRRHLELFGTLGYAQTVDTMGQDPGGELRLQTESGSSRETFPEDRLAAPFYRQIDAVSRAFALEESHPFSIYQDLENFRLLETALDAAFATQTR